MITKIGKILRAVLDQIDIKILPALQNNAKVNMKELSAELNISKTPVYERVKRLEEEGYIRNYVALVDNKKVGLPLVVFCNVSLAVHKDEHIQRFKAERYRRLMRWMECYSIGGIDDFLKRSC
ncbi:MAG: Lrp/AsnC family transcriptional regulator [Parabacteroides sp.]